MSDPKNPIPGDLHIDASDVAVIDITPDEVKKRVKLRAGSDKAIANVERLKPAEIDRAGINPNDVARFLVLTAEHRRLSELLLAAEKLTELLYETKIDRGHQMSLLFGEISAQARRRAARTPDGAEILGPLQDILDYQSEPAIKAATTRGKAKLAQEQAGNTPAPAPSPQ